MRNTFGQNLLNHFSAQSDVLYWSLWPKYPSEWAWLGSEKLLCLFLFVFVCLILQEFCHFSRTWDLHYSILLRMQFLQKFLVFSNIFGFPVVNSAPKYTKTLNLGWVLFEAKYGKILNDFSNSVYLIGEYLWWKFQQDWTIFGGVRAQNPNPTKDPFHGFWSNRKNYEKF